MFQILKVGDSLDDMAKGYVEIEKKHAESLSEKKALHAELIQLKQAELNGEKVDPKIKDCKERLQDVEITVDACASGMETLKHRMLTEHPRITKSRMKGISADYKSLEKEEDKRLLGFLDVAASATVLQEEIYWRDMSYSHSTGEMVEGPPKLKFDFQSLSDDQRKHYLGKVKEYRNKSKIKRVDQSVKDRKECLSTSKYKLGQSLEDPEKYINDLIDQFRPKTVKSDSEDIVHDGVRKTTAITYDYGERKPAKIRRIGPDPTGERKTTGFEYEYPEGFWNPDY